MGGCLPSTAYENRVYQLGSTGGMLVLKFYRPARWSDAQIDEEHVFTEELAASGAAGGGARASRGPHSF